ncbi:hypothetical protein CXZ10_10965 [Pleomorphomonas diazotrophica]|uniref:Methyltransferase FkbM domain-containing protein n=1 Tax=Pleomorphomonas diazotrophica TaxID=1166257 RepID=A0A1I4UGQ9_9HYPH|nr:FkbM family methyltransferase [Pleomorphomonas diazotrophica]PKR89197.1 hypothetical protein CXZ10_10965 [Pleomorphomonas diazotrophica]SFM88187.1 methyltransferase, FkbM family [Pleomorphomonas diazotrophica]
MPSYLQSRFNRVLDYLADRVSEKIIASKNFSLVKTEVASGCSVPTTQATTKVTVPLCISSDTSHFYIHTSDGHRFFLDAKDLHISLHVLEHGCWEDQIRSALMQVLEPGSTFVDVGGNVGLHTLFASSIVGPQGKVYSFEPLPHLFRTLELNVDVNGARHIVTTYQMAISDSIGTASFANFRTHSAMSGFTVPEERLNYFNEKRDQSVETLTVETTTLDSMFTGKRVDALKVDVEGYEALVIRGGQGLIKSNPEIKLILEWEPELVRNTLGDVHLEETIDFLRSERFIPYLALWQQPLRQIEWQNAAAVRSGDLILSRTPLQT